MDDNTLTERDEKKRVLKRYRRKLEMIARLEERVRALDRKIDGLRSPSLSGMPRGGKALTSEDLIADKVDLERRIEKQKLEGGRLRRRTLDLIDQVDDVRRGEVLEDYFIYGMSFGQIAEEMGYTERHIIRLYGEAIDMITLCDDLV